MTFRSRSNDPIFENIVKGQSTPFSIASERVPFMGEYGISSLNPWRFIVRTSSILRKCIMQSKSKNLEGKVSRPHFQQRLRGSRYTNMEYVANSWRVIVRPSIDLWTDWRTNGLKEATATPLGDLPSGRNTETRETTARALKQNNCTRIRKGYMNSISNSA